MAGRRGESNYSILLKDPRWQKRRLKILERDGWCCYECGHEDKTLHVHHRYYLRGKKPWEYEDDALITLCEDCHDRVTAITDLLKLQLGRLTMSQIALVSGYAHGIELAPHIYSKSIVMPPGFNDNLMLNSAETQGLCDALGVTYADQVKLAAENRLDITNVILKAKERGEESEATLKDFADIAGGPVAQ